jgi:hypothetical protein
MWDSDIYFALCSPQVTGLTGRRKMAQKPEHHFGSLSERLPFRAYPELLYFRTQSETRIKWGWPVATL